MTSLADRWAVLSVETRGDGYVDASLHIMMPGSHMWVQDNVLCILTELFSKQGTNGIEYTSKPRSLIVLIRWGTYYYSCVNVTFIPSPLQTPAPVSVPVSP